MRTQKPQALPARLAALQRRFDKWRKTRTLGSRIPKSLWSAAAKQAEVHGIHPTAKSLGLDYYGLKKRVEENSASRSPARAPSSAANFVELAAARQTGMSECIVELEDVEGTRLRIQLKAIEANDLVTLSRGLWGVQ